MGAHASAGQAGAGGAAFSCGRACTAASSGEAASDDPLPGVACDVGGEDGVPRSPPRGERAKSVSAAAEVPCRVARQSSESADGAARGDAAGCPDGAARGQPHLPADAAASVPSAPGTTAAAATSGEEKQQEFDVLVQEGVSKLGWSREKEPPFVLLSVASGGWAEAAGLREGDELVALDGREASGLRREQIDHLVRSARPLRLRFVRRESGISLAQERRASRSSLAPVGLTEESLKQAMEIEEEIRRLKSEPLSKDGKEVTWKNGKLVLVENSESESDDEDMLGRRSALDWEIHKERKRVGIKKAPKGDCGVM